MDELINCTWVVGRRKWPSVSSDRYHLPSRLPICHFFSGMPTDQARFTIDRLVYMLTMQSAVVPSLRSFESVWYQSRSFRRNERLYLFHALLFAIIR